MEAQETTVRLSALSDKPVYNVKAVCLRTGISAATLRAWERRYGLPSPNRSLQGYRLYSERDVAILHWLMQQTNNSMSIRHAEQQLRLLLDSGSELMVALPPRIVRTVETSPRSPELIIHDIVDALLTLEEQRADDVITEALALYTPETVLISILGGVIRLIREEARLGNISAAIEHTTYSLIRRRIILYMQTTATSKDKRPIMLVGFQEERSELDLLMLTALLRRNGFAVINMPANADSRAAWAQSLANITAEAVGINAKAVIFYTAIIESTTWLAIINPIVDQHGEPIRLIACGVDISAITEAQLSPHIEYLGADLKVVLRRLRSSLRTRTGRFKGGTEEVPESPKVGWQVSR
jgi:DNA-binding transcriptional MerR regulator